MTGKRILKATIAVTLGIGVLGACTPEEVQRWEAWNAQDPTAAQAWLADPAASAPVDPAAAAEPPPGVWDRLASCESGGDWAINTGNGYYGGLQMLGSTWRSYGGDEFAGRADQASRAQQIVVAERIAADAGYGAWPACSRRLGLR